MIACMPEKPVMKGLLGICFSSELNAKQFPYGIGVEYDGRKVDDGLGIVTIPAHLGSRERKRRIIRTATASCLFEIMREIIIKV